MGSDVSTDLFDRVSASGERTARSRGIERAREHCRRCAGGTAPLFRGVVRYVAFVGHPRSGHSVLGALLNAHRNVLLSHNLDALDYVREGFGREELFCLILERERWLAERGRRIGGYTYDVPGQWQGHHDDLLVVGDKRAGAASRHLREVPSLLAELPSRLGLPVHVIQHVRNPWDNIVSILDRPRIRRGRSLDEIVEDYFSHLEAALDGIATAGSRVSVTVTHHECLIDDPISVVQGILGSLELPATAGYLDACSGFVHRAQRRTRHDVTWTPRLVETVGRRARDFEVLRGYSFDEP
jgi:hypothetical protein